MLHVFKKGDQMATLNLNQGTLNGRAVSGDDIRFLFTFPFDMTGWGGTLIVRSANTLTGTALVTLIDAGRGGTGATLLTITPGASTSTVSGWLPASATYGNTYTTVYHQLQLIDASGKKRSWIGGEVTLEPGLVAV